MAWVPNPVPAGVGAYSHGEQPENPPENYVSPVPDEKAAPRRGDRVGLVVFAIIVAVVAVTATMLTLTFFVSRDYPEQFTLILYAGNGWNETACISTASASGEPSSTTVSFSWASSNGAPVQLMILTNPGSGGPQSFTYDATAVSGSGSTVATGGPYFDEFYLEFVASGAPVLPPFVNISVSYAAHGHFFGGPYIPGFCGGAI